MLRPSRRHRAGVAPLLALGFMWLAVAGAPAAGATPDVPAAQAEARATVARMSLDEQLHLVAGSGAGYADGGSGTDAIVRLGVPGLRFSDGPNGVGNGTRGVTAFPVALTLAAAWDRGLARRYGVALAEETLGKGRNLMGAPTINIVRSPKWGRVPETGGEDPFLSGTIGAAQVLGLQSRHVVAQVKHYAVNDQEERRFGVPVPSEAIDARVSERALFETYLEPFRLAFGPGGAQSVMCSYNRVNGTPACQNPALLGALRRTLGFTGFVGPDASLAVRDSVAAARAGLDNFSLGSLGSATGVPDEQALRAAVADGRLPAARVTAAATAILGAIKAVGVRPLRPSKAVVSTAAHRRLATAIAARGAVLLRNRGGLLPLRRRQSVAVIGHDAGPGTQTQEFGSPSTNGGPTITPLSAIRRRAGAGRVSYAPGTLGVVPLPLAPAARLTPASGTGRGLTATLYATGDSSGAPIGRRVDATVDVSSAAGLGGARSVRWTGTFTPRVSGAHRFSLGLGGIGALWVDGRRVLRGSTETYRSGASFGAAPPNTYHAVVRLQARRPVSLRVDYSRDAVPPSPLFVPEVHLGIAPPDGLIAAAAAAARRADVAVVFANDVSGEVMDRESLALPGDQDALIEAVAHANPRTVVVLHTAGPVLTPWRSRVAAIVEDWYPGQQTGAAIARVLYGDQEPEGRLPLTFPATATQGPAATAALFPGTSTTSEHPEGSFVGYRFHDRAAQRPAYPFGFGLGYTRFRLGRVTVDRRAGGWDVRVRVTNAGRRTGSQVVQLYLGFPPAAGEPARQLKAFARVRLRPGSRATARLRLERSALQVYDPGRGGYVVRPGRYAVHVGTSSRDLPGRGELRVG